MSAAIELNTAPRAGRVNTLIDQILIDNNLIAQYPELIEAFHIAINEHNLSESKPMQDNQAVRTTLHLVEFQEDNTIREIFDSVNKGNALKFECCTRGGVAQIIEAPKPPQA